MDKAHFGQETGFLNKSDLRIALDTYFRVGQVGGKTLDHFDGLMQALDEDQTEEKFEHKKLFEEDREFNQGNIAWIASFLMHLADWRHGAIFLSAASWRSATDGHRCQACMSYATVAD